MSQTSRTWMGTILMWPALPRPPHIPSSRAGFKALLPALKFGFQSQSETKKNVGKTLRSRGEEPPASDPSGASSRVSSYLPNVRGASPWLERSCRDNLLGATSEVAQRQSCGLPDYLLLHLSPELLCSALWRSQQPGTEQIQETRRNLAL